MRSDQNRKAIEAAWEDYDIPSEWNVVATSDADIQDMHGDSTKSVMPVFMSRRGQKSSAAPTRAHFTASAQHGMVVNTPELILTATGEVIGEPGANTLALIARATPAVRS